jgi:predicted transcriptional regulator
MTIRDRRKALKLTQAEVARLAGVSQGVVATLESTKYLAQIQRVLNMHTEPAQ